MKGKYNGSEILSINETAIRELREETGAIDFDIAPLCVYSVTGKNNINMTGEESFGMLYHADIRSFDKELHSEMERIFLFDRLPDKWTYPLIQPLLIKEYLRRTTHAPRANAFLSVRNTED